jgi:hypothetical protein
VCFGAGLMACAVAKDPRFRAFAGVAGVYTDSAKTREMMGPAYEPALARTRRWQARGQEYLRQAARGIRCGSTILPLLTSCWKRLL